MQWETIGQEEYEQVERMLNFHWLIFQLISRIFSLNVDQKNYKTLETLIETEEDVRTLLFLCEDLYPRYVIYQSGLNIKLQDSKRDSTYNIDQAGALFERADAPEERHKQHDHPNDDDEGSR